VRNPLLALLALNLLLAACGRREADPAVVAEVTAFDTELASMQSDLNQVYAKASAGERDFRGRTFQEDVSEWVFDSKTREKIASIQQRAINAKGAEEAKAILQEARDLSHAEALEAAAISGYWNQHLPAPYWRRYWASVFEANALPLEEPDSLLVSIEERMKTALDKGDFKQAGSDADELTAVLTESLNQASSRILKARGSSAHFAPRKTGCVRGAAPDPTRRTPKIMRAESIETFYPAEAISRGETGAVVLRTRVDRAGCGKQVAVVVHSGVASLDAAALRWFESAQFAPAMSGGRIVEAELTFKVKFELRN
jgi:TonB family protein